MPSATNGNRTVKSASPEMEFAATSMNQITGYNQVPGTQSEAVKQVLSVIEKKVRNMEKKKSKLDDYQARINKGERLNQDQLEALSKFQEVTNNLDFARELNKSFLALSQDIQKAAKKTARRDQLQREEAEQARLKKVLEVQFLLDRLVDETVRQDLLQGVCGPVLITGSDLTSIDEFYKLVGPKRDQNIRLTDQYHEASQHLWDLVEGKEKAVAGTTYKSLMARLERVLQSGYFDQVQSHQNGECVEGEKKPTCLAEPCETDKQQADKQQANTAEGEVTEGYAEPILVETTEFANRQFIQETKYTSGEKEGDKWPTETEVVTSLPQSITTAPIVAEPHLLPSVTPTPHPDPVVRKQAVQDIMAQMQGPYNFMQDSVLEFDPQPLDPAIVSVQIRKPSGSMEISSVLCIPAHSESCLAQPSGSVQPEPTEVSSAPEAYSTPSSMYQPSHTAEPQPHTDSIDPIQASMSQPPPSSAFSIASQTQVFQPTPKPLQSSSGINVNAAPFQSMQTVKVFNLNAPVLSATETDSLKQNSQYQSSYSQSLSSQPQHPAKQTDILLEQHQSVVAAVQDQSLPSATGHQPLQSVGQGNTFGRQTQSFYNSRAMPRGGPRNSRGMINGYRGPSNGFRGNYNGYRSTFSGAPNSGYGQAQLGTGRDYSNSNYQRDGYQQNYKRATGQGPRGVSRGNTQAIRS